MKTEVMGQGIEPHLGEEGYKKGDIYRLHYHLHLPTWGPTTVAFRLKW